jgi:hypothetical protein
MTIITIIIVTTITTTTVVVVVVVEKNKNHDLDLKDRIQNYKNLDKRAKKNNKKSKENRPN